MEKEKLLVSFADYNSRILTRLRWYVWRHVSSSFPPKCLAFIVTKRNKLFLFASDFCNISSSTLQFKQCEKSLTNVDSFAFNFFQSMHSSSSISASAATLYQIQILSAFLFHLMKCCSRNPLSSYRISFPVSNQPAYLSVSSLTVLWNMEISVFPIPFQLLMYWNCQHGLKYKFGSGLHV